MFPDRTEGEYENVDNKKGTKEAEYADLRVEVLMNSAERNSSAGTPQLQKQRTASGSSTPRSSRVGRERTTSTSSIRSIGTSYSYMIKTNCL